jgi:hypothetical protein
MDVERPRPKPEVNRETTRRQCCKYRVERFWVRLRFIYLYLKNLRSLQMNDVKISPRPTLLECSSIFHRCITLSLSVPIPANANHLHFYSVTCPTQAVVFRRKQSSLCVLLHVHSLPVTKFFSAGCPVFFGFIPLWLAAASRPPRSAHLWRRCFHDSASGAWFFSAQVGRF